MTSPTVFGRAPIPFGAGVSDATVLCTDGAYQAARRRPPRRAGTHRLGLRNGCGHVQHRRSRVILIRPSWRSRRSARTGTTRSVEAFGPPALRGVESPAAESDSAGVLVVPVGSLRYLSELHSGPAQKRPASVVASGGSVQRTWASPRLLWQTPRACGRSPDRGWRWSVGRSSRRRRWSGRGGS